MAAAAMKQDIKKLSTGAAMVIIVGKYNEVVVV